MLRVDNNRNNWQNIPLHCEEKIVLTDNQLKQQIEHLQKARIEIAQSQVTYISEKQRLAEKIDILQKSEEKLTGIFKGISTEALRENNQIFLELAQSNFEKLDLL